MKSNNKRKELEVEEEENKTHVIENNSLSEAITKIQNTHMNKFKSEVKQVEDNTRGNICFDYQRKFVDSVRKKKKKICFLFFYFFGFLLFTTPEFYLMDYCYSFQVLV